MAFFGYFLSLLKESYPPEANKKPPPEAKRKAPFRKIPERSSLMDELLLRQMPHSTEAEQALSLIHI